MKAHDCCATEGYSSALGQPASAWRRGGTLAGWIVPGAVLLALPKCPLCLATYVALFSGISLSLESASVLRASLLLIPTLVLTALSWRKARAWIRKVRP